MAEQTQSQNQKTDAEKEAEEERKKEESYKTTVDVERAFHLASTAKLLHDYPALNHLANSFVRELKGMELKQEDLDTKEEEERKKKDAERAAKKQKEAKDAAEKEAAEAPHSEPAKRRA